MKKHRVKARCWVIRTTSVGERAVFGYRVTHWLVKATGCETGTTEHKGRACEFKTADAARWFLFMHIARGGQATWWAVFRRGVAS